MSSLACSSCGSPLALADTLCHACGAPVPQGGAALALRARADQAWEAGKAAEAIQVLERALQGGLPEPELPLAWRKLGIWLEKEGETLRAGAAFQKALGLDDGDAIAHQLFIANAAKQGQLGAAGAFYQKRLDLNPADEMARKQLSAVKLSADFLSRPLPVSAIVTGKPNFLERWLEPKPWKTASLVLSLLPSLVMVAVSAMHTKSHSPLPEGLEAGALPIDMNDLIFNTNSWILSSGFNLLLLYLMHRNKKA